MSKGARDPTREEKEEYPLDYRANKEQTQAGKLDCREVRIYMRTGPGTSSSAVRSRHHRQAPQPAPGASPWPPPGACRVSGASAGHVGALRRAALLLPDLALPCRGRGSRSAQAREAEGGGGGGGPALRPHDARGGGATVLAGARAGDDAPGRRSAAAAEVAGRQSAPRRRRQAERRGSRHPPRGAAGGQRPTAPAPLAQEPGECELRSPPATASPRAAAPAPNRLLASPPPPAPGTGAGCLRPLRGLPGAVEGETRAKGPGDWRPPKAWRRRRCSCRFQREVSARPVAGTDSGNLKTVKAQLGGTPPCAPGSCGATCISPSTRPGAAREPTSSTPPDAPSSCSRPTSRTLVC